MGAKALGTSLAFCSGLDSINGGNIGAHSRGASPRLVPWVLYMPETLAGLRSRNLHGGMRAHRGSDYTVVVRTRTFQCRRDLGPVALLSP